MSAATAEPALFDAVLRPHRSLSPRGFRLLMGFFAVALAAVGALFVSIGAWPILPFCGLELLLLWGAFKINYRAGRGFESVTLTQTRLEVARVRPSGRAERIAFAPPHWLKVVLEDAPDGSNRLILRSHGRSLTIGDFLTPEERASLAKALDRALARLGRNASI